ncbi:MAG: UbiD family decarboxylase [Candidatus Korobacteraceae bacterium]
MEKDLQQFIKQLEERRPTSVVRITREVGLEFEIPAIVTLMERQKKHAVLIFENVRNLNGGKSKLPVVMNLFGSRERLADAIDSTVPNLALDYIQKEVPIPPVTVSKADSPVKQLIQTGEAVDLYELPIITHNEMDLGPYFTAGSAWVKDPDSGFINCAIIRIYVAGPKKLVVNFNAARHMAHIFRKYKERGIATLPMVLVNGHHPAFYMGAQTKLLVNEPDIIGGVMGQGLEVTPSETWGKEMMVPANAELVIEAEISTQEYDLEAPFGEYTQYYGGQRINPVAKVTAITRKENAYYLDIMPGRADHMLLDAPMIEAYLLNRIKAVIPGVTGVHMPVSGGARLHCYIQVKKAYDSDPKTIIATALSSDYRCKHVIVVDSDVDIYDEEQVLWAVATRSQWDKDLVIIPGMLGTRLDPSANDTATTKGGIDATKPADDSSFAQVIKPGAIIETMRLEEYFEPTLVS